MATTAKAQGSNPLENISKETTNQDTNRGFKHEESQGVGEKKEGTLSAPMGEAGNFAQGKAGLSGIPGGKSQSGADKQTATEGWTDKLKQGATTLVDRAGDIAGDVAERAQNTVSEATENVGSTIRRYPVQSVLVGFGVGCLVGLLLPFRR